MVWSHRRTRTLPALFLMVGSVLLAAAPAKAADLFVRVNPSTVQAGFLVGIEASCTDNSMPATVESAAFGTVTVQPQGGILTGAALVPDTTRADSYRVRLNCPDGKSATTRLNVVENTVPSRGPATGFGGGANLDPGALLLTGGLATIVAGAVLGISARRRWAPRRTVDGRAGRRR